MDIILVSVVAVNLCMNIQNLNLLQKLWKNFHLWKNYCFFFLCKNWRKNCYVKVEGKKVHTESKYVFKKSMTNWRSNVEKEVNKNSRKEGKRERRNPKKEMRTNDWKLDRQVKKWICISDFEMCFIG